MQVANDVDLLSELLFEQDFKAFVLTTEKSAVFETPCLFQSCREVLCPLRLSSTGSIHPQAFKHSYYLGWVNIPATILTVESETRKVTKVLALNDN